jgi:hypothetical protein
LGLGGRRDGWGINVIINVINVREFDADLLEGGHDSLAAVAK